MSNEAHTSQACVATMKLLGDYWTLRIIDALDADEIRFCELQRHVDMVNPVTLTTRLKRLEEAHLVKRSEETVDKISVTYALTDLGKEVLPVIKALDKLSSKVQASTAAAH